MMMYTDKTISNQRYRHNQGFTLIELMIVVVVVSLLAMVAIPSYNKSIAKARRGDAQASLSNLAAAMERYFTEEGSYVGAAGPVATPTATGSPNIYHTQSPVDGDIKFYDLTIEAATAGSYTVRATPIGGHEGDGYLELTSTGVERWDKNNDGDTDDAGENHW
jgi:type IV pilus assembly protein PilE